MLKATLGHLKSFAQICVGFHLATEYVGTCVTCAGPSMEPTINTNDKLLIRRVNSMFPNVNRHEVVISRSPSNPKELICKRVVGIAGDNVIHADGSIYEIPKGHVWIEGDNELNSTDSRNYGPVPLGLIQGRAVLRIWPLNNLSYFLPPPNYEPE